MSSRFVRLRPDMSVDEAISYLRIQAKTQVETIYYAYVIDMEQTLVGVISFREMFSAAPHKKIREVMKTDLIKIPVSLDQEQIAKIFSQANLVALPVIDEWGHMKGIVTFDDIASVLQEEATEDIQKFGGVEALDLPYMRTAFLELIQKRAGWLVVLFVGEMFTASAMGYFEDEIKRAAVLSFFIPLIISSGGNSGSQASTLIIRALALGEIRLKDWWRVLGREMLSGLALGLILGCLGLVRIFLWPTRETLYGAHYHYVGLTVAASVMCCVLWGTISGSMLPFILKRMGVDPATASAPFVATLVDVTGLVIYFTMAHLILGGIIL
jgi:magnesium transporter